jgi:hypothetical protein
MGVMGLSQNREVHKRFRTNPPTYTVRKQSQLPQGKKRPANKHKTLAPPPLEAQSFHFIRNTASRCRP